MKHIAVGDVHGCAELLGVLLDFVAPASSDQLVFLGDYVDRGPDSRGVIEKLLELPNAVCLRGNHDEWMLRAREDVSWFTSWLSGGVGGVQTLASYSGLENVPDEHWTFLENLKLYHETEDHIFVHGACEDDLAMEWQHEQVLLWERVWDIAPHTSGKRVICGHTSQKSGAPLDLGHAVCVDTFAHGGGFLTALCVQTNEVWQVGLKSKRRGFLDDFTAS